MYSFHPIVKDSNLVQKIFDVLIFQYTFSFSIDFYLYTSLHMTFSFYVHRTFFFFFNFCA